LKIYQPQSGFRYNSDSLLLYDFALRSKSSGAILDIGCGSGIVGLLLARDLGRPLAGVDKQEEMILHAQKNAEENGIDARFFCMDIAELKSDERFGLIVSNPPFYPSEGTLSQDSSKAQARYAVHMPPEVLIERANAHLHNRGSFVFCYEARALQLLMSLLAAKKFQVVRIQLVHPEVGKEARLVLIEAKKYGGGSMTVLPPFFSDDTEALKRLGERAGTRSMV